MARARAASLWVVNRVPPASSVWNDRPVFYTDPTEHPVGVPLEGFTDKSAADAARSKLERAARETAPVGPFLRGLLPDETIRIEAAAKAAHLPVPDFASLGPTVGPTTVGGYTQYGGDYFAHIERLEQLLLDWWARVASDITPEANATLWDTLFPDFQFYTVTRVLFE